MQLNSYCRIRILLISIDILNVVTCNRLIFVAYLFVYQYFFIVDHFFFIVMCMSGCQYNKNQTTVKANLLFTLKQTNYCSLYRIVGSENG